MKPFAYQLLVLWYDSIDIDLTLPTLRDTYGRATEKLSPKRAAYQEITAHYADGTSVKLPLGDFTAQVELDLDALCVEAREMIRADAEKQASWLKNVKSTVTGSPWLCDVGEETIVADMVRERQYRWKLENEIDWPALEVSLIK